METLRKELRRDGVEVEFVSINVKTGADKEDQASILDKASFPFFQDTAEINAWELHDGGKDDIYIYGADGLLHLYLPAKGELNTNLRTESGYATLKSAILGAMDGKFTSDRN